MPCKEAFDFLSLFIIAIRITFRGKQSYRRGIRYWPTRESERLVVIP